MRCCFSAAARSSTVGQRSTEMSRTNEYKEQLTEFIRGQIRVRQLKLSFGVPLNSFVREISFLWCAD